MSSVVNIHEAKTHFSRILRDVSAGEEVVISNYGRPVAKIVPIDSGGKKRKPGSAKGQISVKESFFDPMPDEFLEYFN